MRCALRDRRGRKKNDLREGLGPEFADLEIKDLDSSHGS